MAGKTRYMDCPDCHVPCEAAAGKSHPVMRCPSCGQVYSRRLVDSVGNMVEEVESAPPKPVSIPTPAAPALLDLVAAWAVATIQLRRVEEACAAEGPGSPYFHATKQKRHAAIQVLRTAEVALLAAVGAA